MKERLLRMVIDAVNQERESSKAVVHALISQEFVAHAPKIIEELFRIYMQNTVLNVHSTTKLWNVLKAKYEKSSTSNESCGFDAFSKRDHDDHEGDDAHLKGEKNEKRQNVSKSSKSARGSSSKKPAKETNISASEEQQQDWDAWVDIPVIDEDEEILKEETSELINEFQNVDNRVPTIFDRKQARGFETTIAEALVFYGPQRNPNEPSRYLYNKDLFFLKNGNTEEKKYMLSVHKIHATSFPKEDLEEKMIR
ncbi:hypothetical protein Tco_0381201 [Tanacetum coccineum]